MTGETAMQIDSETTILDEKATAESSKEQPDIITLGDIKKNIGFIVRATESNQHRLILRAIRNTTRIRTKVTCPVLREAVLTYISIDNPAREIMLSILNTLPNSVDAAETSNEAEGKSSDDVMEVESPSGESEVSKEKLMLASPEIETYVSTLVLAFVIHANEIGAAMGLSVILVPRVLSYNRRTLDYMASKLVFYQSLAYEKAGRMSELRASLLALHRTCCLRHDEIGQATVLNLLLRNLLSQNLLDQAYKLASKTNFPESCSNNQFCRFLYYTGRIGALQLDYTDAHTKLVQCSRKTPQNTALAFRTACQKLMIIVQLLMGEVPERAVFNSPGMCVALVPYLNLTQAVRLGDLVEFSNAVDKYAGIFQADKTYTLIQRLAHNVIKAGLRKVNIAYSRISIEDVCAKVKLDSAAGTEFVCAKAIKDGVIDACIDPIANGAGRCLRSKDQGDLYATDEPQRAFHRRIAFCLDVHNEAVRAMRYPEDAYKRDLERAHRKGLQDDRTEEELAKEIEDEMEDDDL